MGSLFLRETFCNPMDGTECFPTFLKLRAFRARIPYTFALKGTSNGDYMFLLILYQPLKKKKKKEQEHYRY